MTAYRCAVGEKYCNLQGDPRLENASSSETSPPYPRRMPICDLLWAGVPPEPLLPQSDPEICQTRVEAFHVFVDKSDTRRLPFNAAARSPCRTGHTC